MNPKPYLLLDVDGVLNVVGLDWESREVRLGANGAAPSFHPTKYVLPFMRWAWPRFEILWVTAWGTGANLIAKWAGLPSRPALADPSDRDGVDGYKLKAVSREFGRRSPGVPVFWIEDGLGERDLDWISERPWIFYVASEPHEGVTPAHARILAALSGIAPPARARARAAR